MIVIGYSSFQALSTASNGFTEYRGFARETNIIGRIQANMLMVRMNVKDFQITGSDKDILEYDTYLERLSNFINEGFVEIGAHTNEEDRLTELTIIDSTVAQYKDNFLKIQEFRISRDNLVYNILDVQGPFMENTLTFILVSAEDDNDAQATYSTGLALKHLLLARLYTAKFLDTNDQSRVTRVYEEFEKMQEQLDILENELQNTARIAMRQGVQDAKNIYLETFTQLVTIIQERNLIQTTILDKIGSNIAASIENMKLSVKAQQDQMGPVL